MSGKAQLFNFDRCTGVLSFAADLSFVPPVQYEGYGTATFSYEGSKLYTLDANGNNIYQFDLNAPNIAASKTLIFHNPYYNPLSSSFYVLWIPILAPDKKMYVFMGGGVNGANGYISDNINTKVSVIQFPDNAGTSCGFSYQNLTMPKTMNNSNRTFNLVTNYDLGVLENSPCDTLGSIGVVEVGGKKEMQITPTLPNAYTVQFTGDATKYPIEITLTDALGKNIANYTATSPELNIDLTKYAQGIYFISATGYKSVKLVR
jgi:hypothetical protein